MSVRAKATSRYVEVDPGVRVYVEDTGAGTPILFLHGWPVNHKMFEYQFSRFHKNGYRCISVDLRGFGKSDKPYGEYSYDVFAQDVHKVLQGLDLQGVTLAGFSMGGAIALHYMARHNGDRVAKLALMAAAAPCFTKRDGFPYGLDRSVVDGLIDACDTNRPEMLADFGKIFFYRADSVRPPFAEWFFGLGLEASHQATAGCLELLRDADLRPDMAKVKVPTVILHGVEDKICPFPLAEQMHAGIAGSELVRFEKSGHGLFFDELPKFNDELMRFVGRPGLRKLEAA
ncbi:MAG: alpha/beta fold hydrolase [Chloroflexota bacterium]